MRKGLLALSFALAALGCARVGATERGAQPGNAAPPKASGPVRASVAVTPSALSVDSDEDATQAAINAVLALPIPAPPSAPPKVMLDGNVAIAWLEDKDAPQGVESVWIARAAPKTRIVAKRKGPVFVSSRDLWVMASKTLVSQLCVECDLCVTDPPTCKMNEPLEIEEPYLRSLTTGATVEPWAKHYFPHRGCDERLGDHTLEFLIEGAAGPVLFGWVRGDNNYCNSTHPMFFTHVFAFDLDKMRDLSLGFPFAVAEIMRARAKRELVQMGALDPRETPTAFAATAFYAKNGQLMGSYSYTMFASYMGGTGPDHYSVESVQQSDWLPPELSAYGQLPSWVAEFLSSHKGRYAFMLPAHRASAARLEFSRL